MIRPHTLLSSPGLTRRSIFFVSMDCRVSLPSRVEDARKRAYGSGPAMTAKGARE
jgi:hypothetical protein